METLIILQGITPEQLLNLIDVTIEKRIVELLKELQTNQTPKWLTRKETAALLHISLPTLHEWTKAGLLKSYRIGNRILFNSVELEKTLRTRKFS